MKNIIFDKEILDSFIKHITKSGIHGVGSNHNGFETRVINESKNKLNFLLRRLFPSINEMKGIYNYKYSIYLPFLYTHRFIKLVLLNTNTNLKKIKKVLNTSKNDETTNLLRNIGL